MTHAPRHRGTVHLGSYDGKPFILSEKWSLSHDSNLIEEIVTELISGLADFRESVETYLKDGSGFVTDSTYWRAGRPLRAILRTVPAPIRHVLRRALARVAQRMPWKGR